MSALPEHPGKHDLYELCVQSPRHAVALLRAIHGGEPRTLGEDFAGTGALSRAWCTMVSGGRALAVDLDGDVLARCRERWAAEASEEGAAEALVTLQGDVCPPAAATDPAKPAHRADVIFAGNFSIGEIHGRTRLLAYLRHSRARLNAGGVFVCDTYGGETAFMTGSVERTHKLPANPGNRAQTPRKVIYTWEQREADPLTGRVVDALHFRLFEGREAIADFPDAFVYDWRLWSVPELRDAMAEAGFARTEVYAQLPEAVDEAGSAYVRPMADPDELDDSFIVCIAARP